jgi:Flp pilus assembly protein TadG
MASSLFRNLCRDSSGVSAVEFALVAPMPVLGLLGRVDVGIATGARMELDRNVRAGAQAAMSLNNNAGAIESIVFASAADAQGMQATVNQTCLCVDLAASCTSVCPDGTAPSVFFEIAAARPVSGPLFGQRDVVAATRVQIR